MIRDEKEFSKNLPANYDGKFEWDIFAKRGCFGNTKIQPMDFDGVVERNKNYLIFETKKNGAVIPRGQQITLNNLTVAKSFTVAKIWPKEPPFEKLTLIYPNRKIKEITGYENIISMIKRWYQAADEGSIEIFGECGICHRFTQIHQLCDSCLIMRKNHNN